MMKTNAIVNTCMCLLLCLLFFNISYGQENYVSGYVINTDGDTLRGLVEYGGWGGNPGEVYFKSNTNSNLQTFTPFDVAGFKAENEIYIGGIVDVETTPVITTRLKYESSLNIRTDTTFLQVLIRGDKNLYYYENADGKENFYIDGSEGPELLIYKKYLLLKDGRKLIRENNEYQVQLNQYLGECQAIQNELADLEYNEKKLTQLFLQFYDCAESSLKYHAIAAKNRSKIFGLVVGGSWSTIAFKGDKFPFLVEAGYEPSLNFAGGALLDFPLKRNQKTWSSYNELIMTAFKFEGYYEDYQDENKQTDYTTALWFKYFKMNNLIRYRKSQGSFAWFVNGGISNGISLIKDNYKEWDIHFYSANETFTGFAVDYVKKHELGVLAGAGLMYKNIGLELRYERGNGVSRHFELKSGTNRCYLLLSFKL